MSGVYRRAAQKMATGDLDLDATTLRVYMVSSAYTYSADHEFLSSVTGSSALIASRQDGTSDYQATTITVGTDSAVDGTDVTFTNSSATQCVALILVKWGTNAADSRLVAYINSGTGLPVTPNGNTTFRWDDGANKIFKLVS
jgi:hypothetical protein